MFQPIERLRVFDTSTISNSALINQSGLGSRLIELRTPALAINTNEVSYLLELTHAAGDSPVVNLLKLDNSALYRITTALKSSVEFNVMIYSGHAIYRVTSNATSSSTNSPIGYMTVIGNLLLYSQGGTAARKSLTMALDLVDIGSSNFFSAREVQQAYLLASRDAEPLLGFSLTVQQSKVDGVRYVSRSVYVDKEKAVLKLVLGFDSVEEMEANFQSARNTFFRFATNYCRVDNFVVAVFTQPVSELASAMHQL